MELPEKVCNSILFIDFGTANIRVSFFDYYQGKFAFRGASTAKNTCNDTLEGIYGGLRIALNKLQTVIDRKILDSSQEIICPSTAELSGVDQVLAVYSCSNQPRVVLLGLTTEGSLRGMRSLLSRCGITPAAEICASEGLDLPAVVDEIAGADPDIVMLAGGTTGGAQKAVYRLGECLMSACKSLPREQRPRVLFMGNAQSAKSFKRVFGSITDFRAAPNVLEETHGTESSMSAIIKILQDYSLAEIPGMERLSIRTGVKPLPAELAFGRTIRLLSRLTKQNRYVVGVDIGSQRTTFAAAKNLELSMSSLQSGVGHTVRNLLNVYSPESLRQWVDFQISPSEICDYIENKNVYPDLVPANRFSSAIEQAFTRMILRQAAEIKENAAILENGLVSLFLLSGAVLRNVEDPGDALLMAMDGLRPRGISDYYLDMNGISGAIGAMIDTCPEFAGQITSPASFLNLGKVITPVSTAKSGKMIMNISIRDEAGNVRKYEIMKGRIYRIPLKLGNYYELDWLDIQSDTGIPGVKVWKPLGFRSGCFGIVFDCRDNELTLPQDRKEQIATLKKWRSDLGPWRYDD